MQLPEEIQDEKRGEFGETPKHIVSRATPSQSPAHAGAGVETIPQGSTFRFPSGREAPRSRSKGR